MVSEHFTKPSVSVPLISLQRYRSKQKPTSQPIAKTDRHNKHWGMIFSVNTRIHEARHYYIKLTLSSTQERETILKIYNEDKIVLNT